MERALDALLPSGSPVGGREPLQLRLNTRALPHEVRERVRVEKKDHRPVSRTCDVEQPLGARGQLAGLDHALQFIDIARFQIR
jgi:hypothetical protein